MERAMTNEEICRHYRLAADKRDDIVVLADLNMTSREEIERILTEGGELVPEERKQRRTYKTKRGAEIEERLRKGQSVERIARDMGMKEASVLKWIQDNGKEDLLESVQEEPLPPEEEERRMEEKRKRMIRERKKEEKAKAGEPAGDAKAGIRMEDRSIMNRVEAVIGVVPADACEETRTRAFYLCGAIFREWLLKELDLTEN